MARERERICSAIAYSASARWGFGYSWIVSGQVCFLVALILGWFEAEFKRFEVVQDPNGLQKVTWSE
jgi:hypothetical protein